MSTVRWFVCLVFWPTSVFATTFGEIPVSQVIGSPTITNDANVTLTLSGTPTDSLLKPVTFTLGWTGVLSVARGGTGGAAFESPLTFQHSVSRTGNTVNLVNDSASPGNSKYYGTDGTGVRGYFAFPDLTAPVTSVFSRTGDVVAASGDYNISQITDANPTNWDTAYTDRLKWDGGATGLNATNARVNLGLVIGSTVEAYLGNPSTDGYVLSSTAAGVRSWIAPGGGGGAVSSVFGRIGDVVAATNDYTFAQIGSKPTTLSGYGITDAEPFLGNPSTDGYVLSSTMAGVRSWIAPPSAPVSSVFGRTGAVVAAADDYTFAQIGSKPTTLSGYGITDAVLKAGDTMTGPLQVPEGTGSANGLQVGAANTGLNVSTGNLRLTVGGSARLTLTSAAITGGTGSKFQMPSGTAAAPSYSFSGEPDGGLYVSFTDTISMAAGGAQTMSWAPTAITAYQPLTVPTEVYGAGWNGDLTAPTKDDLYDKIESMVVGGGGAPTDALYLTATSNGTLTNEVDIGAMSSGLLKTTTSGGLANIFTVTDNSSNWDTAFTDRLKWDGGSSGLTASTGRTSLGGTTVGQNIFTLPNPLGIRWIKINADQTVTARTATETKTDLSLDNVENTALSTWTGSTSLTTLGTVATGTWNATAIAETKGGMPTGGTANQVLTKLSSTDYDTDWKTSVGVTTWENGSSADQTGFAAYTYITGSAINTGSAGNFKVGGAYYCHFDMVKTAAGTAGILMRIYSGTTGTTSDTVVATIGPFPAGTAAIDTGYFELWFNFRTVGASTVVAYKSKLTKNATTTGLANSGTQLVMGSPTVAAAFNNTTHTTIGIGFNGGASFSGTTKVVHAVYMQ
jgi:hypothetical protein